MPLNRTISCASGEMLALRPAAKAVTAKTPTAAPTQVHAIPIQAGMFRDWSIHQLRWQMEKRVGQPNSVRPLSKK